MNREIREESMYAEGKVNYHFTYYIGFHKRQSRFKKMWNGIAQTWDTPLDKRSVLRTYKDDELHGTIVTF